MTEEPIREGESEERPSLAERMRSGGKNVREKLAKGGVFALSVFFAIGVVFGVSAKTLAARSLTIGYWDYLVTPQEKMAVDLNAIQKKLLAAQADEAKKQQEDAEKNAAPSAGANSEGEGSTELPPPPPAPPTPPDLSE